MNKFIKGWKKGIEQNDPMDNQNLLKQDQEDVKKRQDKMMQFLSRPQQAPAIIDYNQNGLNQQAVNQAELYRRFYHVLLSKLKEAQPKTVDQKLDEQIYSLREIESLFSALAFVINNSEERESFEKIFNNWKDAQLEKRY